MNKHDSSKKSSHLTSDDRVRIEESLRAGHSPYWIAQWMKRPLCTITREIRRHAIKSDKSAFGCSHNRCVYRNTCKKQLICEVCCQRAGYMCSRCIVCNLICEEFVEDHCNRLTRSPFVCNGCPNENRCPLEKYYYIAEVADEAARELWRESHSGFNCTEEELRNLEQIIAPGIRKGQSPHHVVVAHKDEITVSTKTIYRLIKARAISLRDGDLRRKVHLRPRKMKNPLSHKIDRKCRVGRTLEDYLVFLDNNGSLPRIQMDTVIGRVGGKVILTILFCESKFMIARLLPNKTSKAVIDAFNDLTKMLGNALFKKLFPALLTDNGTEFSNPTKLETFADGSPRTRIFYCDGYSSNQKAEIERNHELLRYILPKKPKNTSFDRLTQEKLDVILSHINSYARPKLGDKTPIELFTTRYSTNTLNRLHQKLIPPDLICLKPDLLTLL